MKLSQTVSKLWTGHECSTADGRTDGRTDTQKFGGYNIIPRHFLWRGYNIIPRHFLWRGIKREAHAVQNFLIFVNRKQQYFAVWLNNPLYTNRFFHCYMLEESICHFSGLLYSLLYDYIAFILFFMENPISEHCRP